MSHIYNRDHKRIDTFTFWPNNGGGHHINESGVIVLTFRDKEFVKCEHPFSEPLTRNQMRILHDVELEIRRIEADFNKEETIRRQHSNLLNAVHMKHSGELRYITALRYIEEAEGQCNDEPKQEIYNDE